MKSPFGEGPWFSGRSSAWKANGPRFSARPLPLKGPGDGEELHLRLWRAAAGLSSSAGADGVRQKASSWSCVQLREEGRGVLCPVCVGCRCAGAPSGPAGVGTTAAFS